MSLKRLGFSFKCALAGVSYALKNNQTLQIHFIASLIVIVMSLIFHVNAFEMGILGVMILLVISAEMINTSIEQMTDLITSEHRMEAKIAKDVAAGMVLIIATGSVMVGFLIFAPYVQKLFR